MGQGEEYKNTFLPCKSQNAFSGSLNLSLNLYWWLFAPNRMNTHFKETDQPKL